MICGLLPVMFVVGVVFAIVASEKVSLLPTVSTVLLLEPMKRTPRVPHF
jgi:hypothetical protein